MAERTVRVFTVIADGAGDGPAGDGTYVHRFRSERDAQAFARAATCYGNPACVCSDDAPLRLAQRWGLA